jgi:hypothetical protein
LEPRPGKVGLCVDGDYVAPDPFERRDGGTRTDAVRAVDGDAQTQIRLSGVLGDCVEVSFHGFVLARFRPSVPVGRRCVFDEFGGLLFIFLSELTPVVAEKLDSVVAGRVV